MTTDILSPARRDWTVLFPSVAAPACFLGGWLLMRPIGGQAEPGAWWTAAHAVWLLGFALFAVVGLRFRSYVPARTTGQRIAVTVTSVIVVASAVANIVQLTLDLVGGFLAANREELQHMFAGFQHVPGVQPAIYGAGAQVIFLGLVGFSILAAIIRRSGAWTPTLVAAGTVVMAVGLAFGRNHWLVPVGMTLLLVGLAVMGRQLAKNQPIAA
jgi:hypothetical protein